MSAPPSPQITPEQLRENRRVRRTSEPFDASEYHTVVILVLALAACIFAATAMQDVAPTYFVAIGVWTGICLVILIPPQKSTVRRGRTVRGSSASRSRSRQSDVNQEGHQDTEENEGSTDRGRRWWPF